MKYWPAVSISTPAVPGTLANSLTLVLVGRWSQRKDLSPYNISPGFSSQSRPSATLLFSTVSLDIGSTAKTRWIVFLLYSEFGTPETKSSDPIAYTVPTSNLHFTILDPDSVYVCTSHDVM